MGLSKETAKFSCRAVSKQFGSLVAEGLCPLAMKVMLKKFGEWKDYELRVGWSCITCLFFLIPQDHNFNVM